MPVAKGNRKESKVEFDNNYFKIYTDYMRLKSNNFGVLSQTDKGRTNKTNFL